MEQGCPKEKLIIGIPTYGRSWTLGSWSNPVIEYNINATALGGGQNGPLTRAKGFLAYHEICNFIINEGWTKVSNPTLRMGPYAYKVIVEELIVMMNVNVKACRATSGSVTMTWRW